MIGKVVRGSNVGGLLRYLYGPGRTNEHTDPHLVAGFGDPQELEPDRRADGTPDLRRLTGLLLQPLAADPLGGCEKPVWHCSVRAAPGDRVLSDAEWGQVGGLRSWIGPGSRRHEDEAGVRWVAVRHAADHIHIVATLARQDGGRVRTWNDFFRVREACRDAERRLGLTATAPADRTAAKRASRAETEQAARRGWGEAPRVSLRREVCTAAAGASSEREFFGRLERAGVLVRKRHSTVNPGEVTGYSVGLAAHTTKDGAVIWYGGGKLAPDLTLPKLRARWAGPAREEPFGAPVHGVMARAVLRSRVTTAAGQARDEAGFFAQLRESGVLVRLRYSEINPGEVTGYAVALPGHTEPDGTPRWYGGGRLAAGLTLPRLRQGWNPGRSGPRPPGGAFRFTGAGTGGLLPARGPRGRGSRGADPAQRRGRPCRGRRYGLGGGRDLPRDGASDPGPGAAPGRRHLRPGRAGRLREDPAPDHRGRPAARRRPAPGHDQQQRGRQHHAHRAHPGREPGQAGEGGRRAAPGAAARRAGGSSEKGGRRPVRRAQPVEGRRCGAGPPDPPARRGRPGPPGGQGTQPGSISRSRCAPVSRFQRATAPPAQGHTRPQGARTARRGAPVRRRDERHRTPDHSSRAPAIQCRVCSIPVIKARRVLMAG